MGISGRCVYPGLAETASTSVVFCLLAALAGCAPGADLKPLAQPSDGPYRLGVGDQIRVITFGEQQLSDRFRVGASGDIAMPLLGAVLVAGQTPEQVQSRIADALKSRDLIRAPSVSVEVEVYRPISIIGEVSKPGQYPYQPGMTMLTAVAAAGGFTYRAVQSYAADIRTIDGQPIQGKIIPSSFIAPGDVITIYERRF